MDFIIEYENFPDSPLQSGAALMAKKQIRKHCVYREISLSSVLDPQPLQIYEKSEKPAA